MRAFLQLLLTVALLSVNVTAQSSAQKKAQPTNQGLPPGATIVPDDDPRWEKLLKAAEQGSALEQVLCGARSWRAQRYAEAANWYRRAAEQGFALAQVTLGKLYYNGTGVRQDYAEAAKWFRKAAEQGDAEGQWRLGGLYSSGEGVRQDYAEAAKWFRKAAEQGDANGQVSLAFLYVEGKGVPQDYVQAHMWANLAGASDAGDVQKSSAKVRDILADMMTREQIAEAQRLARDWKPTKPK
jgi:hypothetical protein